MDPAVVLSVIELKPDITNSKFNQPGQPKVKSTNQLGNHVHTDYFGENNQKVYLLILICYFKTIWLIKNANSSRHWCILGHLNDNEVRFNSISFKSRKKANTGDRKNNLQFNPINVRLGK